MKITKIGKISLVILFSLLLFFEILSLILIIADVFAIYYFYFLILIISGYISIFLFIMIFLMIVFYRKKKIRKYLLILFTLVFLILINIFVIYSVNKHRKFLPYEDKIQSIIQSEIVITPEMKNIVVNLEEPYFYSNTQTDYIIGSMLEYSFYIFSNKPYWEKNKAPNLSSYVAITLMRDQKNINLNYTDMGDWHFHHFIWTYALNQYFSKDEILHIYCYYFFNIRSDVIDYSRTILGKNISDCSEDDYLKLSAYLKFPGNNIRGSSDLIMSKDNYEKLEQMRLEEYQRLKKRYNQD